MGKNKQKGKKQKNVFQVANNKHQQKSKSKAKPVTSSLKHIKTLKNEKVENLNQMFTRVQKDVTGASKPAAAEAKMQVVREPPKEAVNVDNAAELFSQL